MPDYKEMYLIMVRAAEQAQNILIEAQQKCEEMYLDAQDDEDFGKEAYRLSEIRTAPFYGAWFGGSLLTTCDGLTINEECQVLTPERTVIEGLYAIGDCSGSFFANNYPEYLIGVACGRTLTQGRHVVRKLAGDL